MWSLLTKLSPLLLASSTSTDTIQTQNTITTTSATWPPQKASDLTNRFRQLYLDLEQPGPISKHMTPTLRFSYVPPPVSNSTLHGVASSSWTLLEEQDLEEERRPTPSKPLAIYLPGLDGYGISARTHQFDDLSRTFEFWRLTVLPEDMSSFLQVVDAIANFIEHKTNGGDNSRQVVLIGESCGGLLASAVAHRLRTTNALKGLVLVNPATFFDQTSWDALVPLLTSLQYLDNRENPTEGLSPYAVLGSLLLSGLIPDSDQFARILNAINSLPNLSLTDPDRVQELFHAMTDAFRGTEERLPAAVLEHRVIKWLLAGTAVMNARLPQIQVPTLVVAGEQDRLMPSLQEANRLVEIMPNAEKLIVRGRGHFVLDETVNLTEAILFSKIDPLDWKSTKAKYDPILDWKLPSRQQFTKIIQESVQPLRTAHSPVFFSTDEKGKRWSGLSKIPRSSDGPLLFVANHQFAALDMRLFMAELIEHRNIFPRGLAHPVAFPPNQEKNELHGRTPGLVNGAQPNPFNGEMQTFGAVVVTPRNYYRLLQSGQDALLFPGGAREAFSGRKDYPLFWPDKVDFVRTAARFNATIVPLSAIGMVDSVNVLAEPEDVFQLPFIGERAKAASQNVTSARYDQRNEDEIFGFPLFTLKLPSRNYFLFGKPISACDIDPSDKEACARLYGEVRSMVRIGLDDLLRARERDPFRSTPKRLAYERLLGKKAPTFPVEELNRE